MIRLGALGDLVLSGALLGALAEAGHELVLLTARHYQPVAEAIPGVSRRVYFERDLHDSLAGLRQLAAEVGEVDLVLDLQNKLRTQLLGRLIASRVLRSLRLRSPLGVLRALLGRGPVLDEIHQVQLLHDWAEDLLVPGCSHRPRLAMRAVRRDRIALVPGAAHASKRWPAERYGELARALIGEGHQLVVVAGPGEEQLVASLQAAAGRELNSTLGQGVDAVMQACASSQLVVGGDTGPLHVAAALDTPVLALFGPTSTRRWRPLGPGALLVRPLGCQPCSNHGSARCPLEHHDCMLGLGVAEVLAACRRQLARSAAV